MRYNVLSYLLGEGFRNVFKNKKSTGAALAIMCATMLIFGVFFMISENINHAVKELELQQGMQVFVKEDSTEEQVKQVGEKIKALDGINTVTFVSKEEGLNTMKQRLKDKQSLLSGYETDNPLPDSYLVTLTDLKLSSDVQNKILSMDHVKSIQSRDETIQGLLNIASAIKIVSGVILILLVIISIFIIANTIKLTVHARRKEISIMKYVGATNGFIRWPFIVEGIIIGIIAALISILLIGLAYNGLIDKIAGMTNLVNIDLLTFSDMFTLIIFVYMILGIGVGALGSAISMRKYLKV